MKLLCLSRDQSLNKEVYEEANEQSWSTLMIQDRESVQQALNQFEPDMLLVDMESNEDLQWWQENGLSDNGRSVLFLNRELTEDFAVRAFECGAVGLVPRQIFSRRLLAARMKAHAQLKAIGEGRKKVSRLGLILDGQRYRAEFGDQVIPLTLTEFRILRELATEKETVVPRQDLQVKIFGTLQVSKRSLDVHICALRKKLAPYNLDIDSARGVGYQLNPCRC